MEILSHYIPSAIFILFVMALLFVTSPDRAIQIRELKATGPRLVDWFVTFPTEIRQRLPLSRIIFYFLVFWLGAYIWTYQVIQSRVTTLLEESDLKGVDVASLVIPYLAVFQTEYESDTGFVKSRKRARAKVSVEGSVWTEIKVHISKRQMVKVKKIAGAGFTFSYLTDTKVLKPEIQRFMKKMARNKEIYKSRIETFDNRGPYILVVLAEKDRAKDVTTIANDIAAKVHGYLTKKKKLKVNQVIIKVVDPEQYTKGRVKVLGRGKAGTY